MVKITPSSMALRSLVTATALPACALFLLGFAALNNIGIDRHDAQRFLPVGALLWLGLVAFAGLIGWLVEHLEGRHVITFLTGPVSSLALRLARLVVTLVEKSLDLIKTSVAVAAATQQHTAAPLRRPAGTLARFVAAPAAFSSLLRPPRFFALA